DSGGVVTLVQKDAAQVVQRLRDANILLTVRRLRARQRLLEQRLRLVENAEAAIRSADRRQNLRLQFRLADQFLLHLLGARVEEPANRRFGARGTARIRISDRLQAGSKLSDFVSLLR